MLLTDSRVKYQQNIEHNFISEVFYPFVSLFGFCIDFPCVVYPWNKLERKIPFEVSPDVYI